MSSIDKRIIDKGFHTGYEVDYVTIPKHDYEYLKKQAERVQELKIKNKHYQELLNKVAYEDIDFKQTVNMVREYLEGEE